MFCNYSPYIALVMISFVGQCFSQPLQLNWVAEYPCYGPNSLEYDRVLTDEAQNVYLCGKVVTSNIPILYGSAMLVLKFDSTGEQQWEAKFDNRFDDYFRDCTFNGDDGIVVAGLRGSLPGSDPNRAELACFDKDTGQEQWHSFIFDTVLIKAGIEDIDKDINGSIYAFGQYWEYPEEYDSSKAYVAKINPDNGNIDWAKVLYDKFSIIEGKVMSDRIRMRGFEKDGSPLGKHFLIDIGFDGIDIATAYLPFVEYGSGLFYSYFFFDHEGYYIGFGKFITKSGISQPHEWTFDFARGLPNTIGQAMTATVDEEGNIYASGYIKDTITTEEFTQTIKLSPAGDLLWATVDKFSDGTDFERGQEIAVSPYHVFVSSMIGYNTPAGPAAQKLDYRPILYSQTDGSILYDTLIDVNVHDFHDYAHYDQGHFYLLGRSYLPSSSDPDDYRYQLFKFGVEEPSATSGQVEQGVWADVFPNPTSGSLTISQPEKQYFDQAALYDAKGRLVHSCLLTGQEQKLLLPELAAGVYSLELKGNSAILTKRIVIQP